MRRADAGQAARDDLAALGHELAEQAKVLVVDVVDLLDAELALLLATEEFARTAGAALRTSTLTARIACCCGAAAGVEVS